MSSTTPNLNLTLPTGTENVSRHIINENNEKIDTAVGELNSKIAYDGSYQFYSTYPNGKRYNQNNFWISIPLVNPNKTTPTVSAAYVYSESGSFIDIKENCSIALTYETFCIVAVLFDPTYAHRLLRIDLDI